MCDLCADLIKIFMGGTGKGVCYIMEFAEMLLLALSELPCHRIVH